MCGETLSIFLGKHVYPPFLFLLQVRTDCLHVF